MNPYKKSKCKLIDAGYQFLRPGEQVNRLTGEYIPIIKVSEEEGKWRQLAKFTTKAERDRKLSQLVDEEPQYLVIDEPRQEEEPEQ